MHAYKSTEAPFEPLTVADVANYLKIDAAEDPQSGAVTDDDATLTMLISTVRGWWEYHTGFAILRSQYKQVQKTIKGDCIRLLYGPVLRILTFKYRATLGAAYTTLVNTQYVLGGATVVPSEAAGNFPAGYGADAYEIVFECGIVDYAQAGGSPTPTEILTAQAAVPYQVKQSLLQAIGHLNESREGSKPMSKFEADSKLVGLEPPNTQLLTMGYRNLSLLGHSPR